MKTGTDVNPIVYNTLIDRIDFRICTHCHVNPPHWVFDNTFKICTYCGNCMTDNVTDEVSDDEFYKKYKPGYIQLPYMRSKNFRKLMRQALGRQRVHLPKKFIESIRQEIIYPDREEVRRVLRSMGLNKKYYKHVNLIVMILDGVDTKLPVWVERTLETLYCQYEHNYDDVKLNKKKFPTFNYLNRKGLELIEQKYGEDMSEYFHLFPDVKQKRTRISNDIVFNRLIARDGISPLIY